MKILLALLAFLLPLAVLPAGAIVTDAGARDASMAVQLE